jgi:hypothetical protein
MNPLDIFSVRALSATPGTDPFDNGSADMRELRESVLPATLLLLSPKGAPKGRQWFGETGPTATG